MSLTAGTSTTTTSDHLRDMAGCRRSGGPRNVEILSKYGGRLQRLVCDHVTGRTGLEETRRCKSAKTPSQLSIAPVLSLRS